jgi:uncharacterized protein YndB with AHSA1/START domain
VTGDLLVWNGRVADLGPRGRTAGDDARAQAASTDTDPVSEGGITPMKRIEATHRFGLPVERGFAFITDTANWPAFWPGYVRLEEGSSWRAAGDTVRLVTRLFGRERLLTMTITTFEPNRLVRYTSTQPGLPDALHERHFQPDAGGFVYRLVVEYEPRGILDRLVLPRGIARAFGNTLVALERELSPAFGDREVPDAAGHRGRRHASESSLDSVRGRAP